MDLEQKYVKFGQKIGNGFFEKYDVATALETCDVGTNDAFVAGFAYGFAYGFRYGDFEDMNVERERAKRYAKRASGFDDENE